MTKAVVKQLSEDLLYKLAHIREAHVIRGSDDRAFSGRAQAIREFQDRLLKLSTSTSSSPEQQSPCLRVIHHFACTGGTIMSKSIGTQPNVRLLSEVEAFSEQKRVSKFQPTNLPLLSREGTRPASIETQIEVFISGLNSLLQRTNLEGMDLVLRAHPHSYYCQGSHVSDRPTFQSILKHRFNILGVVSVRHPIDSYESLKRSGWIHFTPPSLDEYCNRYRKFLDDHQTLPLVKYEEFVADPTRVTASICDYLQLSFSANFVKHIALVHLSGNSGRAGAEIVARRRRKFSPELVQAAATSRNYLCLCDQLGYSPSASQPTSQ